MKLPTLATPRLSIRPFALTDVPAYVAYHDDPEVARYQSWEVPYPAAEAEAHARQTQLAPVLSEAWATLTLHRQDDLPGHQLGHQPGHQLGHQLGHLALRLTGHRTAEVGFTLARAAWGHGYAHEALSALVEWLFTGADLHRVQASLDPRNERSAALLKRCGFRAEGVSVQAYWHRAEWTDDAHYALLRSEWQEGI
ncbi:GNAT family protein [Deinococcus sp.]|uniref:GNAT family N-acetyltransferase n=1 Tax=Deinococcus sp. TaxID=47478 RepID=UPI0025E8A31B|nr:GNAT family protein [Deinococcus sp.]